MILSISYDLHNPGRDYDNVIATIKSVPNCHPQGSVWLVDTTLSPLDWVKKLKQAGDPNDEYLVCQLAHNIAWENMDKESENWLRSPSRNW